MAKSKKVRMPAGVRNKLMAAVSMLLVSTIMMVSTTYAWFTLSTAPEVTGITTSVGANGNLEMALLNTDTFADMSTITSAVGDSSSAAGKSALTANITWGNLVELSDESYGQNTINLMPARLNVANEKLVTANLLKTAVYGKDGRVDHLDANTYSTVKDANGWSFDAAKQTYGVRAIGANDNLTPQQSGLMQAKSAYTTNLNAAKSTMRTSMETNGNDLAGAVSALAMGSNNALTDAQKTAITQMVDNTLTALGQLDTAYVQVLAAAASTLDSTQYLAATGALKGKTSYAEAKAALEALADTTVSEPEALATAVASLETQKTNVQNAKTSIAASGATDDDYKGALRALVEPSKVLINGYKAGKAPVGDTSGEYVMDSGGNIASDFMSRYAAAGGLMVQMPDGSGVFAYIGSVAGNYSASVTITSFIYGSIELSNVPATMQTTATKDTNIDNALSAINANGTTTGATALSDTFGYALDFAFRTNAANSYLQLQTEAAQRVYTDSTSTLTQGNGSTMTFKSVDASFTGEKVKSLMQAIRVAFVNPDNGTVYGIAALGDITVEGENYTGKLYLQNYTFDTEGKLTTTGNKANADGTEQDESKALMAMQQNTAQKMTVIVWLDGDTVSNGDVANAQQSITGSLNLQFSSSAELVPMQNTALKNLTASEKTLTGIEITTPPTKTAYTAGETFSAEGMVVKAKYSDSTEKEVTGYTCTPAEALTAENTTITVSYTEGTVTKTATVTITVS